MTDHHAFLAAIIAAPDDDWPRLVFAEWLDERGEAERAEFIRVQCELVAIGQCGHNYTDEEIANGAGGDPLCGCRWCALRRRERELLSEVQDQTRDEWIRLWGGEVWWDAWQFRRGFVEEITCSWSDWRTHADAIRAATPLRRVRSTTPPTGDHVHFELMRSGENFHRCDLYPSIEFELPQPNLRALAALDAADNIWRNMPTVPIPPEFEMHDYFSRPLPPLPTTDGDPIDWSVQTTNTAG